MRIIAGEFKGRVLRAPKGSNTRPTTDRVREALFSALSSARGGLEGAVVLDAFAGSGALSLEALSRGAARAHLFERDRAALDALNGNVRALGLSPNRARVHRGDVFKDAPLRIRPPFDVVFLDPPYAYDAAEVLGMVARLGEAGALAEGALVVYEHAASSGGSVDVAAAGSGLTLASRKKYGDTVVDILRRAERREGAHPAADGGGAP